MQPPTAPRPRPVGLLLALSLTLLVLATLPARTGAAPATDAFSVNRALARGVNVLGYDPIWRSRDQARFETGHFALLKNAGFNTLRVNLHAFRHMEPGPAHSLKPEFWQTLDWIVSHALTNRLHVILDLHEFNATAADPDGTHPRFLAFWRQMADHFRNAPPEVVFELLNEPNRKLTPGLWNAWLAEALAIIRPSNPTRAVIIGPPFWNSVDRLDDLKLPADDRHLIVTVHYYKPMAFTHQGAAWSEHKDQLGVEWRGSPEEQAAITADFDKVQAWATREQRPIHLGEYGAYDRADMPSRQRYTAFVARTAERLGWSWAYWQFDSDFILYDIPNRRWIEPIRDALVPPAPATGFYRIEQRDGRWWFIDPAGQPTLSKGVCHITFNGDSIQRTSQSPYRDAAQSKHGGPEPWRQVAATRLLDWGFNSLGAWSDAKLTEVVRDGRRLADAPIVDFGSRFVSTTTQGGQAWLHGIFPDVFDPRFEPFCLELARERCAPRKDDPAILGWFTDNELRWGPDWRGNDELLTLFLNLPTNAPGRIAAVDLLRQRHTEIARFNQTWKSSFSSWDELARADRLPAPFTRKAIYSQNEGEERQANDADPHRAAFVADCEAFLASLAERYFRITREAIRAADPNHLNFGARFAYVPPTPVRASAAAHLDVISFNCYQTDPTSVVRQYAVLGRPMIIGEFTFRADDVGLPNTRGAGPKVPDQTARAAAFERYIQLLLTEPLMIGYHWFQHNDQPKEGRFDGENSNYGVVNGSDQVYPELTRTMTAVNAAAERWHAHPERPGFLDPFVGSLRAGWTWIREDAAAWRLNPQGLQVRVQPGNMWGPANNALNLLARPAPNPAAETVTASVTISNQPTEQYEQVNLVWYYDDSHMVKIGQELVDGSLSLVMGREENDQCRTLCILPIQASTLEIRLTVRGNELTGDYRPAGTAAWLKAGGCTLPVHGEPRITLQAYQGPAQTERWATFSAFRLETRKP